VHYLRLVFAVAIVLVQGCAGLYFKDAGAPPAVPRYTLDQWPTPEYWTGIVFNGEKIGFTHLAIAPDDAHPGSFVIRSEASLRFHFLTVDKQVKLLAEDRIKPDLTLQQFSYDYDLDGNRMTLTGAVTENRLQVSIETAAGPTTQVFPLDVPVYPASIINLYPVTRGLSPGVKYEYTVYDGESQRLATVSQDVAGYERSDLFEGPAFRIVTRMHGATVTTWINERAEPVLEMSMNGIFIAGLESEWQAKRFLAQAALNKEETLLNFSLVPADIPVSDPRQAGRLELEIRGADGIDRFPSDGRQQCTPAGGAIRCLITGSRAPAGEAGESYLGSSIAVTQKHPVIRRLADEITRNAATENLKLGALLEWMHANIRQEATDVFTALDVLDQRKAECQGYSFLFASFARALGIPTRVVNGLVYSEGHPGFLYHTWVESLVDGHWQAIDPIFGQLHADATHIKLVEGENLADLAPLLGVIGRLSVRILAVDTT